MKLLPLFLLLGAIGNPFSGAIEERIVVPTNEQVEAWELPFYCKVERGGSGVTLSLRMKPAIEILGKYGGCALEICDRPAVASELKEDFLQSHKFRKRREDSRVLNPRFFIPSDDIPNAYLAVGTRVDRDKIGEAHKDEDDKIYVRVLCVTVSQLLKTIGAQAPSVRPLP